MKKLIFIIIFFSAQNIFAEELSKEMQNGKLKDGEAKLKEAIKIISHTMMN